MTAGGALVLERFGDDDLGAYYRALVSREYDDVIEGAMFLTEKRGGSDVGAIETMADLAEEDPEYVRLVAKRLAHYVFDVFTARSLLSEAQADLEGEGPSGEADGRTALVAIRFVTRHLADREARGITSGDRFPVEYFDAILRFEPIDPDALAEAVEADRAIRRVDHRVVQEATGVRSTPVRGSGADRAPTRPCRVSDWAVPRPRSAASWCAPAR